MVRSLITIDSFEIKKKLVELERREPYARDVKNTLIV